MAANIIGIIAALTLTALVLGILIFPYLAALHHVVYEVNATIITGAIAALSGIISAVAVKKIQNNCNNPNDKS
jgi:high-affinity Fe2+/Pb2+ permease